MWRKRNKQDSNKTRKIIVTPPRANSPVTRANSPVTEKKSMAAPSKISRRCCVARVVILAAPALLFLRVAYHSECFTAHHTPLIRKKLPGSAWPLKFPMMTHGHLQHQGTL